MYKHEDLRWVPEPTLKTVAKHGEQWLVIPELGVGVGQRDRLTGRLDYLLVQTIRETVSQELKDG